MKRMKTLAALLECLGIAVVCIGIGLELALGGTVYLLVITGGSAFIAIGSLLWAKCVHTERKKEK